ncbi:MAG: sigma-70 family RNA polymerase sigma factor [Comamonas sp.]|nr:sigma-70 family RNA polymerase sigma factor [Comamonas sp.]
MRRVAFPDFFPSRIGRPQQPGRACLRVAGSDPVMKRDAPSATQGDAPQAPSADALASLYQRWRSPLVRLFQRRSHSREQSEEAAQEVFVRLAISGKQLAPDEEKPYLSTVARSVSTDDWRKAGRGSAPEMVSVDSDAEELAALPSDDTQSPLEIAAQRQRIARLNDAVAELPERQRQAFLLNRIDGLSHDEVAAAMGISPRMVAKHLSRAMAYCQLRLNYASLAQMQRLLSPHDDPRDESAAERKDLP